MACALCCRQPSSRLMRKTFAPDKSAPCFLTCSSAQLEEQCSMPAERVG